MSTIEDLADEIARMVGEFRDDYGGVAIDYGPPATVTLYLARNLEHHARILAGLFPTNRWRIVQVRHSLAYLKTVQAEISRDQLREAAEGAPIVSSVGIDVKSNVVTVSFVKRADNAAAELARRFGADLISIRTLGTAPRPARG